ncbi:MAG: hypothetical protein CM15mP130_1800 [Verrucomicrobiota bacterium]|nr:MAG: hypothetical protein CM15mP130_1800 [Verrucomicrobiota bacterium]
MCLGNSLRQLSLVSLHCPGRVYMPGAKISGSYDEVAVGFHESHCFGVMTDETSEAGLNLLDLGPQIKIQCRGANQSGHPGDNGRNASQKTKKRPRYNSST